MGSESAGGGGGGRRSRGLVEDRARHVDARSELGRRGSGGQQGTSIDRTSTSRGTTDRSPDAGQGGGGDGAALINPVIINQAAAPSRSASDDGEQATAGTLGGSQQTGRAPQRSLLTLGLAETARKTLLGL